MKQFIAWLVALLDHLFGAGAKPLPKAQPVAVVPTVTVPDLSIPTATTLTVTPSEPVVKPVPNPVQPAPVTPVVPTPAPIVPAPVEVPPTQPAAQTPVTPVAAPASTPVPAPEVVSVPPTPTAAPAATTPARIERDVIAQVAASQLGYKEGFADGHWDNIQKYSETLPGFAWSDGQAWCDVFVAWVFWTAGLLGRLADGVESASCAVSMQAWKNANRWSEYPALGAQVIFHNGGHTGLVIAFDATTITTIEGNTNSDGGYEGYEVMQKTHQRTDPNVTGYGYPTYAEGIVSADPAWGATGAAGGPAPVAAPATDYTDASLYPSAANPTHGTHGDWITWLGQRLVAHGYTGYQIGPSPSWGPADQRGVKWFQEQQGWSGSDADGYPGPETLKRLAA